MCICPIQSSHLCGKSLLGPVNPCPQIGKRDPNRTGCLDGVALGLIAGGNFTQRRVCRATDHLLNDIIGRERRWCVDHGKRRLPRRMLDDNFPSSPIHDHRDTHRLRIVERSESLD